MKVWLIEFRENAYPTFAYLFVGMNFSEIVDDKKYAHFTVYKKKITCEQSLSEKL